MADALVQEAEARAQAEEAALREAGLELKITELTAQLNEVNAQALQLAALLEENKAESAAAQAEAQARADALAAQAASLTKELEATKAQYEGELLEQGLAYAKLETTLAESEAARYDLKRRMLNLTANAVYWNNTVCTFGLHLRDLRPELTDKWYTVTPIDLSADGTQSFELVGSNMWIIGHVRVTVEGDSVLIDRDIILDGKGRTRMLNEYLNIFHDLNSITKEALEDDGLYGRGFRFGEPISIEKDLKGDTSVLLYVRSVASFNPRVTDDRFLERMWKNLPHRIAQRDAMLALMDPLTEEETVQESSSN